MQVQITAAAPDLTTRRMRPVVCGPSSSMCRSKVRKGTHIQTQREPPVIQIEKDRFGLSTTTFTTSRNLSFRSDDQVI